MANQEDTQLTYKLHTVKDLMKVLDHLEERLDSTRANMSEEYYDRRMEWDIIEPKQECYAQHGYQACLQDIVEHLTGMSDPAHWLLHRQDSQS